MINVNFGIVFKEIKTDNEGWGWITEIHCIKEISEGLWVESLDLQVWWQIHGTWGNWVERPVGYDREGLMTGAFMKNLNSRFDHIIILDSYKELLLQVTVKLTSY